MIQRAERTLHMVTLFAINYGSSFKRNFNTETGQELPPCLLLILTLVMFNFSGIHGMFN